MKTTILILCVLATALPLAAADPPKPKPEPPTYLTAAEDGRDYADQGEYLNDWGGAQVLALGDDTFRLVTYKGGLPGAGWDRETRCEVEGKRDGEAVRFAGNDGYSAALADGTLTITTSTGGPYTMKKTDPYPPLPAHDPRTPSQRRPPKANSYQPPSRPGPGKDIGETVPDGAFS